MIPHVPILRFGWPLGLSATAGTGEVGDGFGLAMTAWYATN